jgi:tRNA dimethylallyltransferase
MSEMDAVRQGKVRAVLIAGPTASGKSAVALALAQAHGGVVINADSMQVYGDLRLITARPSAEEEAQAEHVLYGHVDAAENYSVGRWCVDVQTALAAAEAAGRLAIVVGGTGLYFKMLLSGLAAVPPIPADIRADVRGRLAETGVAPLYTELLQRDPVTAARLMPGDRSRISRALEVVLATGRSLTDWHRDGMPAVLDADSAVKLFLTPERKALVERIEARFDVMLAQGALDEVRALKARRLDPTLPAMKAHGVPWLIRHLGGDMSLEDAATMAKQDTRRYAKRQTTWFRNQMPGWTWTVPEEAGRVAGRMLAGIG